MITFWYWLATIILTNIKLVALFTERVAASSSPVMLFQNQDFLPNFGQQYRDSKATNPAADDNGIQVLRYFTSQKTWRNIPETTAGGTIYQTVTKFAFQLIGLVFWTKKLGNKSGVHLYRLDIALDSATAEISLNFFYLAYLFSNI